jgi:hypothetical protein
VSADNWATCPVCFRKALDKQEQAVKEAAAAYGVVPAEEYEGLLAASRVVPDPEDEQYQTFREDYEIWGASTGTVKVDYSGHCDKCNTGLDFEFEREIPGIGGGTRA